MSKTVVVTSTAHFDGLLKKTKLVVVDFHAEWCAPCKQIAPLYEKLATQLTVPSRVLFTKVNIDEQKEIATRYQITTIPTFYIFRDGQVAQKFQGADPRKLELMLQKITGDEGGASGEASGSGSGAQWHGADIPRGYRDVTDQVEVPRCELLNVDSDGGGVRVLFSGEKPSNKEKDWVESDTDEQLMLFIPFQSMIKLHTLQLTSIPPTDDDEAPMRPQLIKLYSNKPHNLGFDEADDTAETQEFELTESDWNAEGTANIALRFVKFQNINSLVIFIVSGDGSSEKVRLDRIRLIGETGAKREMGKLEKIGDEPGE